MNTHTALFPSTLLLCLVSDLLSSLEGLLCLVQFLAAGALALAQCDLLLELADRL